ETSPVVKPQIPQKSPKTPESNFEQITSPQNPEINPTQLKQLPGETSPVVESQTPQKSPKTPESNFEQTTGDINSETTKSLFIQKEENQKEDSPFKTENNINLENSKASQGFFTGGKVTQLKVDNHNSIAASDTVPAMLTPGEFVVNSTNAQKNLPLLEHINKGGKTEDIPKISPTPEVKKTEETSFLTSPSLGLDITKQNSSFTNNQTLNSFNSKNNNLVQKKSSNNNYSSPPLILKKINNNISSQIDFETPSEWSTVEELMNIGQKDDNFINLNSKNEHPSNYNSFNTSKASSNSPSTLTKQHHDVPIIQGFSEGGEVKKDDISKEIEPITETINVPSYSSNNDEIALESLAREIYRRLRQELEIEKERQGSYLGRLPW
ncbi:MAG: hypothetical protein AAF349_27595, partial [Cyanobacteria bacterium P01_A01_bin.68]